MKDFWSSYQKELALFYRLSVWIGAPIIPAIFLGKWLDGRLNTAPWLFLGTVFAAFAVSMTGLVIEAGKSLKEIKATEKNSESKPKDSD